MQNLLPATAAGWKGLLVPVSGEEFLIAGVVVFIPGLRMSGMWVWCGRLTP